MLLIEAVAFHSFALYTITLAIKGLPVARTPIDTVLFVSSRFGINKYWYDVLFEEEEEAGVTMIANTMLMLSRTMLTLCNDVEEVLK